MGKELIINLLLLWALSGNAAANGNYYFRHYSNRDGLSHNTVYAAIQDSKGFMWFATEAGLNRFDGHDFRVFRNLPGTASSLLKDNIHDVFEDSKGRIWVCTSGGMCSFNYEDETFTPLILPGQSQPYFARQVLEDGKGFLWLRYHFYFTRYNPDTKEFKTFPSAEYGFRTIHMTINSDGGIVFADQKSIYVYNYENENFTQTVNFADKFNNRLTILTRIQEIPHIGYLIGTDLEGLKLYHSNSGEIETLIGGIHVRNILNYDSNTYWIASESGIYIYNFIDRTTVNLRKSLTNDYSIADNAIYSLTKDSEGGIWATSFFGGVNYLPKTNGNFTYYIGGKTHPEMLGNTVREICPDNDGNLWLATEDNGVNRYNPQTGEMLNITRPVLSSTNIHGLYVQGDTLWIGTFNRGIDLLQISTGKVLRSYRVGNTDRRLQSNFVLCFSRLRSGDFLVGTHQGVFRYLPHEDSFEKWRATNHNTRHIFEDHRGNVWVTTQECLYRATPDSLYVYSRDNKSLKGLGSHNTTSVFEDSKQRIWITTEGGLSLYDAVADTFGTLTTADGLPSNLVYRIVEDRDGLFWISTSCGLLRFNPDSRAMHVYSYSDGLFEAQFNYSSSYMSPEGVVYMGTVRGMLSFRPHAFIANDFTPRLYIRRVHVHDNPARDMYLLDSKTQPVLRLPYNSATFTISYIAPSYTSPDAIKYSYRLEGVDRDWLEMDNFRDVTFANLSPGTYLFKVRSTNGSDEWQDNEQALKIVITPPFWVSIWAFMLYAAALIACAVMFYRYKKRQLLLKMQRRQELFESEKEKELYNAKIRFFTFVTHEIRTPLTLIKAPLEKIIGAGDGNDETRKNLRHIEKNTKRLLDLSNQLLDFRKAEIGGYKLNFVKSDLNILMETVLSQFAPVYQKLRKIEIDLPEKHIFAYIDKEAFTKIMSNLLTNAFKYSAETVTVEMLPSGVEPGEVIICVSNDGALIPEKEREKIFTPFYRLKESENIQGSGIGLALTRSLAELHKGSITYSADTLNRFTLRLPTGQEGFNFDSSGKNEAPAAGSVAADTDRKTLLIAEDQPDMRQFLVEEFRDKYETFGAANGREALQILAMRRIDVIISDIMMPEMDGYELCNAVKNNLDYSHIPFIALTARHDLQSRLTGLNSGADAYLEKPFSLEHMVLQVENLLRNRERLLRSYLEKPFTPLSSLAASQVDNLFIEKLNAVIDRDITVTDLSVEGLSKEMNMSQASFYRKVKALAGISPVDFIRMARLKKAIVLMQQGERRISEIAYAAGFSSPAYFSTTFQKQYSKTPTEFIKEMQNTN